MGEVTKVLPPKKNSKAPPKVEKDDTPAAVDENGNLIRVPRPDSDAKEAKVSSLSDKINALINQKNDITKQQENAKNLNKPYNEKRKTLWNSLTKTRDERKTHFEAIKGLNEKIDKLLAANKKNQNKEKELKDKLGFQSVDKIDQKIKEAERRHETSAGSKEDEKRMMREISKLKDARRKLIAFKQEQAESGKSGKVDDIGSLRASIKEHQASLNKSKPQMDELNQSFNRLNEENKAASSKMDKLYKRKGDIMKDINSLYAERDAVKAEFAKEWNNFKKYQNAVNKLKEAERKKQQEEYEKKKEEYEKMIEEEEAKKKTMGS